MSEITTRLTCQLCNAEFDRNPNGGRKPLYCTGCRVQKSVLLRAAANAEKSPTVPCVDCSAPVPRNNRVRAHRCASCKEAHQVAVAKAASQRSMDRQNPLRNSDPVCKECGKTFQRAVKRGRRPDFCPDCARERNLARARAYMAQKYVKRVPGVPETFSCADCGEPFEFTRGQGNQSIRCRPCQKLRLAKLTAARRRTFGRSDLKFAPGQRSYPCTKCGVQIACKPTGRKPLRCASCRKSRSAEQARLQKRQRQSRPPRQIICIDCGIKVILPLRGASKQKRCARCATKAARVIQKRMSHERRALKMGADAEKFTHLEIFERDGWKCGICKKRINKRLKHPHPMSASLDHIIPLTKGGSHTRAGVQASHLQCNLRKYNLGGGEQLLLVG